MIRQRGISLIELMVSVAAGAVVIVGVTSVYLSTISSSNETLRQSKLTQETTALMTLMGNDLRRAGIWGALDSHPDYLDTPQENPFAKADDTALSIFSHNTKIAASAMVTDPTTYSGGECILFSYDRNSNGNVDADEILGFRRITLHGIGVVQMRTRSNSATTHDNCNDEGNVWGNVSDSQLIDVTALNFTLKHSTCINSSEPDGIDDNGINGVDDAEEQNCYTTAPATGDITAETRQVDITLKARLIKDSSAGNGISQSVRIRNDLILATP